MLGPGELELRGGRGSQKTTWTLGAGGQNQDPDLALPLLGFVALG